MQEIVERALHVAKGDFFALFESRIRRRRQGETVFAGLVQRDYILLAGLTYFWREIGHVDRQQFRGHPAIEFVIALEKEVGRGGVETALRHDEHPLRQQFGRHLVHELLHVQASIRRIRQQGRIILSRLRCRVAEMVQIIDHGCIVNDHSRPSGLLG